jgi:hypothetical protein
VLKKIFLAVMMVLPFASIANVALAEAPLPQCFPCPDGLR